MLSVKRQKGLTTIYKWPEVKPLCLSTDNVRCMKEYWSGSGLVCICMVVS